MGPLKNQSGKIFKIVNNLNPNCETVIWVGITSKKITCPIGDSACGCHINKNIKIIWNYVKYFPILLGVRNTDS